VAKSGITMAPECLSRFCSKNDMEGPLVPEENECDKENDLRRNGYDESAIRYHKIGIGCGESVF